MDKNMQLCFCINDFYAQHLGVVLTSILKNNKDSFFEFNVISSDLSDNNLLRLNSLIAKYKNFKINLIRVNSERFKNFDTNIDYISVETYFRYILADLLPNIDKVLYMDVDLIVNGDLTNLWNIDIDNYYCAAVEDLNFDTKLYKSQIGMIENEIYINAGVILFNLKKIRQDNISKKFFENHEKYKNIIKYQDQDIINITLGDKIKNISCIYNFTTRAFKKHPELLKKSNNITLRRPRKTLEKIFYK